MRVHVFQHIPFENEANIGNWARDRGHTITRTRFYADDPLPGMEEFDLLLITGGFMSAYEQKTYPWLVFEKEFIRAAIVEGRRVLGICLGAQLVAEALGGAVSRNAHKEIGWMPVTLTPWARKHPLFRPFPRVFTPFHWHGDTFEIPPNATRVATSEACANQGFVYGSNVVGLQFHLEYGADDLNAMVTNCGDDLAPEPFVQSAEDILAQRDRNQELLELLYAFLDVLAV